MHVTSYLFIFIGHYNVKQAKRERHALPTGAVRNELEEPRKFPNINYLGSSYNIFKGNPHSTEGLDPGFMGQGLYEFSYHQGKVTPDGRYCIPDNMSVMESLACSFDFSSRSIKEITSYFQSLEVDVDADFTGYGASFSASTNYKEVKENTDSREIQYVSSHAYCEAYLAALEPGANLAEGFIRAVNGLPNTTNNAKYFDFIRAYGTHYVASVRMGGRYGFQSKFETNSYMSSCPLDWMYQLQLGTLQLWSAMPLLHQRRLKNYPRNSTAIGKAIVYTKLGVNHLTTRKEQRWTGHKL